jgi:hypothetical protein
MIFPSKRANCPFCGGRIYSDEKSDSVLQSEGFTLSDIQTKSNNSTNNASDDFHIDDSDILSSLRQSYDKEHRRADRTNYNTSTTETSNRIAHPVSQGSTHTMPETSRAVVEAAPPTDDFFSQFQASTTPVTSIPTVGVPSENSTPLVPPVDDGIENELQSIERQQRRIRNNYRRLAIMNFFSNINWRIVFRIIIAVAVVFGVLTIWKMRYIILDSILNFFIALIPIIIIIWIIIWIFKSLFK